MNDPHSKDYMRLWRDGALGQHGVDLLTARCHSHDYKPHFHGEYVIACFASGAQVHNVGKREGVATRGHVLIIPPGEAHAGRAADPSIGWSYRAFYPDVDTLTACAEELFVCRRSPALNFGSLPLFDDPKMARRLAQLHVDIEEANSSPLARQEAFGSAMAAVLSRYLHSDQVVRAAGGEPTALKKARDLIHSRFRDRSLSVGTLASEAGLSAFHFMRVFRAATGITAHNYVVQLRLAEARCLIAMGMPLAEAAAASGFADQSHLHRHFLSALGVTPGHYAKATAARRE